MSTRYSVPVWAVMNNVTVCCIEFVSHEEDFYQIFKK